MWRKLIAVGLCGAIGTGCGVSVGDPTISNSSGADKDKTLVLLGGNNNQPRGYMITVVDSDGGRREYTQMQTIVGATNGVLLYDDTQQVIVHCGNDNLEFDVDFSTNKEEFPEFREEFYLLETGCPI